MQKIDIKNLTVKYENILALESVNVTFEENNLWAICGPNGAGKSTLLKSILGLVKYTGQITFQGIGGKNIAYLPQISTIDNSLPLSVYELVSIGLWYENFFYKGVSKSQKNRINAILNKLNMYSLVNRKINELSIGQLQKVLFARMLIQEADFFLLDEPFNSIDIKTVNDLLDLIYRLNKNGKTVICVTHDVEQAKQYFTNTLILSTKVINLGLSKDIL